jgi:hypothetical protein
MHHCDWPVIDAHHVALAGTPANPLDLGNPCIQGSIDPRGDELVDAGGDCLLDGTPEKVPDRASESAISRNDRSAGFDTFPVGVTNVGTTEHIVVDPARAGHVALSRSRLADPYAASVMDKLVISHSNEWV